MDPRVFRRVQRYGWDAATNAYDRGWVPQLERADGIVRRAREPAGPASGCWIWRPARAWARSRRRGRWAPRDPSRASTFPRRWSRSRAGARRTRASGTSSSSDSDMEATGAADGAFDAVTCAFGLMFAADRAAAFAEIARVTAPGGRVSVCVWGRRAACGFAEVFPIVDAHVDERGLPAVLPAGGPGALTAAFERAGLTDVVEESVRGDAVVGVGGRGVRGDAGGRGGRARLEPVLARDARGRARRVPGLAGAVPPWRSL